MKKLLNHMVCGDQGSHKHSPKYEGGQCLDCLNDAIRGEDYCNTCKHEHNIEFIEQQFAGLSFWSDKFGPKYYDAVEEFVETIKKLNDEED